MPFQNPSIELLGERLQLFVGRAGKELDGLTAFCAVTCASIRITWCTKSSQDPFSKGGQGQLQVSNYQNLDLQEGPLGTCLKLLHPPKVSAMPMGWKS
jgi:hypothetical protein